MVGQDLRLALDQAPECHAVDVMRSRSAGTLCGWRQRLSIRRRAETQADGHKGEDTVPQSRAAVGFQDLGDQVVWCGMIAARPSASINTKQISPASDFLSPA